MLPGLPVPGCCFVFSRFLCYIHSIHSVTPNPTSTLYILLTVPFDRYCSKMKQGAIFFSARFHPSNHSIFRIFLSIEIALKLSILSRRYFWIKESVRRVRRRGELASQRNKKS